MMYALGRTTVAAMVLIAGCGTSPVRHPTANFQANGVTVTVALLPGSPGGQRVQAVFRPEQPGFHLYSVELPPGGVDGLGIPTGLDVRGDLRATGKPTADLPTRLLRPAGLQLDLPVYPDGPVTVTLPVQQTGAHQADILVSYAACSERQCLAPVTGQAIPLTLSGN